MKRIAGFSLCALALVAAPVSAQQTLCVDGNWVCVDATFSLSGNTLQMDVYNSATAAAGSSRLWGVALFDLPSGITAAFTSATFTDNGAAPVGTAFAAWGGNGPFAGAQVASSIGGGNGGNGGVVPCDFGGGPGSIYKTCEANDYVRFNFLLSGGVLDGDQLAALAWGFRALSTGPDGENSEFCATIFDETSEHFCSDPDDPGGPQETVPEPATMTLLATGLVGMAAARRRKKQQS